MKTTLDIDDQLIVKAKTMAARERKTLTRLIEEGLRLRLRATQRREPAARSAAIRVSRGRGGIRPGIDPLSNRSMFEAAGDDA